MLTGMSKKLNQLFAIYVRINRRIQIIVRTNKSHFGFIIYFIQNFLALKIFEQAKITFIKKFSTSLGTEKKCYSEKDKIYIK